MTYICLTIEAVLNVVFGANHLLICKKASETRGERKGKWALSCLIMSRI